jgi:aspartyl-tRNA(Asn)/glutamyl-tRNA(Gln) amidotransferase subunit B
VSEPLIVHHEASGADWEVVVGLEVHCELDTATKLFCGCPNDFGSEPNTNVCPVCLGLPGSLPVVNEAAVTFAMRLGRALGCEVRPGVFARKNYFYPDMPKDYQVSQYDRPTNVDGSLTLADGTVVGIERAHIEEDTGKNTHAGGGGRIHGADYSLVDYNRAGVPLVEIVGRPDIRSGDDAKATVDELRAILLATEVSDARMEEGSMRVDANVSVRLVGSDVLGTRCEVKNLNSLRSLGRAIEHEARRQVDLLSDGQSILQETRHWDEEAGRTRSGRPKSDADDYRYFAEPDLLPLDPSVADVDAIDAALPALPAARRARLADAAGVSPADVALIVSRRHDDLALAALEAGAEPGKLLNRVEHDLPTEGADGLDAAALAELVRMETDGELTATQAKTVLAEMVDTGRGPAEIATERGFEAMASDALATTLDEVIGANPESWVDYCALDDGDKRLKKLTGFFTGEVMKATKGQADGRAVNELLADRRAAG